MLKKQYPTVQKIKQEFVVTDDMWKLLVDMGEKENIKLDTLQLEKSKKYLSLQLKALNARDMMDNQAYFEIINDENDALKQAILLLQNKEKYNRVLKGKNQMK
jgi:carboxyl-terminal processing protease